MLKYYQQLGAASLLLCYTAISYTEKIEQCFEPDHYISYIFNSSSNFPAGITIDLEDQFEIEYLNVTVTGPVNLLNPSSKFHNSEEFEPKKPRLHYVAYSIVGPTAPTGINLSVSNQFGVFPITGLTAPNRLLVPSLKNACEDCDEMSIESFFNGDHYLCYPIAPTLPAVTPPPSGSLIDQFQERTFEALTPTSLCNPVRKTSGGNVYDYHKNPENHLMCFTLASNQIAKSFSVLNQFGLQEGFVRNDVELCVPSSKEVVPLPPSPLRAFVTSNTYNGNLAGAANGLPVAVDLITDYSCSANTYLETGVTYATNPIDSGVSAADCLCRQQASTQNLLCASSGDFSCWKAWISDSSQASEPDQRFNMAPSSTIPIYEVDALGNPNPLTPIANGGYVDLVSCGATCLDDPLISPLGWLQQDGVTRVGLTLAWTNTNALGLQVNPIPANVCDNWSSNIINFDGRIGRTDSIIAAWTNNIQVVCLSVNHLYCFEDIP